MRSPEITEIEKTDNELNMGFHLQPENDYFKGHFPEFQLLPGVVQVHWAIEYAIENFGELGEFEKMEALKFSKPMRPGMNLRLNVQRNIEKSNIVFKYLDDQHTYSSGRIYFK